MDNIDKIKEKIQKLLALQESAQKIGSYEEAANAADKIQILLLKFNLSMDDVPEKTDETKFIHIELSTDDIGYNPKYSTWNLMLLNNVVRLNFCRMVNHTGGSTLLRVSILGEAQGVELSRYLYDQLYAKVMAMEKRAWKEYEYLGDKRGKFRRGYLMGASMAISARLQEMLANIKLGKMVQDEDGNAFDTSKCNALIVRKDEAVADFMKQKFDNLRLGKAHNHNGSHAVALGMRDGKSVSINQGVSGGRSSGYLN